MPDVSEIPENDAVQMLGEGHRASMEVPGQRGHLLVGMPLAGDLDRRLPEAPADTRPDPASQRGVAVATVDTGLGHADALGSLSMGFSGASTG